MTDICTTVAKKFLVCFTMKFLFVLFASIASCYPMNDGENLNDPDDRITKKSRLETLIDTFTPAAITTNVNPVDIALTSLAPVSNLPPVKVKATSKRKKYSFEDKVIPSTTSTSSASNKQVMSFVPSEYMSSPSAISSSRYGQKKFINYLKFINIEEANPNFEMLCQELRIDPRGYQFIETIVVAQKSFDDCNLIKAENCKSLIIKDTDFSVEKEGFNLMHLIERERLLIGIFPKLLSLSLFLGPEESTPLQYAILADAKGTLNSSFVHFFDELHLRLTVNSVSEGTIYNRAY